MLYIREENGSEVGGNSKSGRLSLIPWHLSCMAESLITPEPIFYPELIANLEPNANPEPIANPEQISNTESNAIIYKL